MTGFATTVRPGLRYGERPEKRSDAQVSSLDARVQHWIRRLLGRQCSFGAFRPVALRIHQHFDRYALLSEDALNSATLLLRQNLRGVHQQTRCNDADNMEQAFGLVMLQIQRTFGIRLHDEQLFAAWNMLQGVFVEMATGEGKTLTAAIPATIAALRGTPVHVVTANDYLVERDAQLLRPLYRLFGLQVGFVRGTMNDDERRAGYCADIVYCANKQLVFDYLRDLLRLGSSHCGLSAELQSLMAGTSTAPLLRGLCFAIVDEADQALIDDARTPIILSRSLPADRAQITESKVALSIARALQERIHFVLDATSRQPRLTSAGEVRVEALVAKLPGRWQLRRVRDELLRQALIAMHSLRLDRDYLVREGRVELIEEASGRILEGRKFQHGVHRCLEIKEKCAITDATEPLAALSLQRFFPRFLHLTGMSGTLWEVRHELAMTYGAAVVRVPRHHPGERQDLPSRIACSMEDQLDWVLADLKARHSAGQPVLIGTRSMAVSDLVSRRLQNSGIAHRVLNARQDADEAEVIAQAGRARAVTVATNMAGRGTDIPLEGDATDHGGLHVMCLEVNDSTRVDRQLFGRSGRQDNPGSAQRILTLEDELLGKNLPRLLLVWLSQIQERFPDAGGWAARLAVRLAQWRCERRHAAMRRAALEVARQIDRRLAFTGDME